MGRGELVLWDVIVVSLLVTVWFILVFGSRRGCYERYNQSKFQNGVRCELQCVPMYN